VTRRPRFVPADAREERLFDLMYERAFAPLSPEQQRELDALSAQSPDVDFDCYDRAAAAIDLYCRDGRVAPMPAHLKQRILSRAPVQAAATTRASSASSTNRGAANTTAANTTTRSNSLALAGWIAAAAATIVAVIGWMRDPSPGPKVVEVPARVPTHAERRAELLANAKDVVTTAWKSTDDPNGKNVSGDVVWSPELQRGFMRFRGLPRNEATRSQYQLWIFDKPRGTDHPIDGGVFDVASIDGDVIVPIDAKLKVFDPAMFAVTEEAPGGVVVSKREHIVALAQL